MGNINVEDFHFGGWATKNDLRCQDGRTIRRDAFKHCDGETVPLIWNHDSRTPENVLGEAVLENRPEGVYAYGRFNDTKNGQLAHSLVESGNIRSLSIYANGLKQLGSDVVHGSIRELSLVAVGANPGATIDFVMAHGDDEGEGVIANYDESVFTLYHSDKGAEKEESGDSDETIEEIFNTLSPKQKDAVYALIGLITEGDGKEDVKHSGESEDRTIGEIFETLNDDQKTAVYAIIGQVVEEAEDVKHSEGGNDMHTNVFEQNTQTQESNVLTHSAQAEIIALAKQNNVGSFQTALSIYAKDELKHGIDEIETLFPEYKDVRPGAPELIERDQTWVGEVMRKTNKSPIARIRTRQADARGADLRAKGYQKKGDEKTVSGNIKLMGRTTDPQTVYRKDAMHRDDILDITDFDVVEYMYGVMKSNILEDIALATMVGDLREDGDPDKISEEHIRPIWKDDELYTIHYDVDIAKTKNELQGSNTSANFGENYIYAEALVAASLYSREQYKGSGNLEFYCTPHLLNVMLLARDLNGRRIYDSKADLAKALNVSAIHTAEQFEGLTRTTKEGETKKLLGIFVNLKDYQHGSTKGGEITRFEQFDIDFNQNKYLIETRLSGALTRIKSAIALEEPVVEAAG